MITGGRYALAGIAGALAVQVLALTSNAAVIRVDASADDMASNGNCTLREAMIAANTDVPVDGCDSGSGADTIVVPAGTYVLRVNGFDEEGAAGDLDLHGDIEIRGADADGTVIDGNLNDRVLDIHPGAAAQLSSLTVQHGSQLAGGGIRNRGRLRIDDCVVRSNSAIGRSGSVPEGGGISNEGELTIENSVIRDNSSDQLLIFLLHPLVGGRGGGIHSSGTVTIARTTISGNTVSAISENTFAQLPYGSGAGIYATSLLLVESTVTGNGPEQNIPGFPSVQGGGNGELTGGPVAHGRSIAVDSATIVNSTISENHAASGAAILGRSLTISATTISHNQGGGLAVGSAATLRHTIIANNVPADCFSSITSSGTNLDSDASCGLNDGDLSGVDPLLGPLQDNGGPTLTRALLPASPAIDAGSPDPPGSGDSICELTDQRGVPRPQGMRCDIGALEVVQSVPPPSPTPTATVLPNATATPPPASCVGDCDHDGAVHVEELMLGIAALLDQGAPACPALDRNEDRHVTIDELVMAVSHLLGGCERGQSGIREAERVAFQRG